MSGCLNQPAYALGFRPVLTEDARRKVSAAVRRRDRIQFASNAETKLSPSELLPALLRPTRETVRPGEGAAMEIVALDAFTRGSGVDKEVVLGESEYCN